MTSSWKKLTGRDNGFQFCSDETHSLSINVIEAAGKYNKTKNVDCWQKLTDSRILLLQEHCKHMKKDGDNMKRAQKTIRYWQYARINFEPTGYENFEHERSIR